MVFGDKQTGYSFVFVFCIKDSEARGFQRWHSIVVLSPNLHAILLAWPLLEAGCRFHCEY